MFSLFSGKISSVFSLAFQGLTKAVGFIVETVTSVVDTIVDTVSSLTSPITETLTQLPVIGDTVQSVLDLESNLLSNLSGGLHAVANELSQGDLFAGITTALNGVTATLGETVGDGVDVLENAIGLTAPVTGLIGSLPVLGGILDTVTETSSNLIGFVDETADYVASTQPSVLISGLISDPTGSIGNLIHDATGTIENLLDAVAPVTNVVEELPILGNVVGLAGQATNAITDGLYDFGTLIGQIDLVDSLQQHGSIG